MLEGIAIDEPVWAYQTLIAHEGKAPSYSKSCGRLAVRAPDSH